MDERSNKRVATNATADCTIQNRTIPVLLWDLSVCGCKLEFFDAELKKGDRVAIRFEMGIVVPGTVVWQKMGFAGILFSEMLHEAAVRHLDLAQRVRASRFELPPLPHTRRGLPVTPQRTSSHCQVTRASS